MADGSALPPVSRPEELRGVLENIYHGWLDIAAERALAGKPAPSATEAANAFAYYAAPLVRAALRAGPPGEPSEAAFGPSTREWAKIRAEAFQRVADFFRETADTKPEWTAQQAADQWQMYADSVRDTYAIDGRGTATPPEPSGMSWGFLAGQRPGGTATP